MKTVFTIFISVGVILLLAGMLWGNNFFEDTSDEDNLIEVSLFYKDGEAEITSLAKRFGFASDLNNLPQEGYRLVLQDKNQKELSSLVFNFPLNTFPPDGVNQVAGEGKTYPEAEHSAAFVDRKDAYQVELRSPEDQVLDSMVIPVKQNSSFLTNIVETITDFIEGVL